jgi:hypothetical protein
VWFSVTVSDTAILSNASLACESWIKDYSNDDYFKYECHPEKYGASFLKYYIERYQGF